MSFADAAASLELDRMLAHIAGFAASELGRERVRTLAPSDMFAEVRDELDRVREMAELLAGDDAPPVDTIADIRAALHRAMVEGSALAAEDARDILRALQVMRALRVFLLRRTERAPLLAHLAGFLADDKMLEFHIDRVVDDEGAVRDGASKELRAIRRELIEKAAALRRRMEVILKRVSEEQIVMEDLVTMRDGRMVLPVKAECKRQVQGFIHGASATGQTVYIEPAETLELNNDVRDLEFAEAREVHRILTELTDRLRRAAPALLEAVDAFAALDALSARCRYAQQAQAAAPVVRAGGPLQLYQARHPVLMLHKKWADIVPLDIVLGDPETAVIITGPNAGGKSVAMKTVGLQALLVQCGVPVPCDARSEFPVYRGVYVDIGDEQSVENDLSTFSSHVRRLAAIADAADERSLVLIDEIGTGTDPAEGSALGAAILDHLAARRAHVIATTHHGMLKAFAHDHPGMMNAAMEFDLASLQPTYRFRAGLPGSSYAFEITRRHGMRADVLARAREILGTQSDALERLLAEVETQAQDLGSRIRRAEQREDESRTVLAAYEERMRASKSEVARLRREAADEARRLLDDANAAIERAVREIREEQASREAVQRAHAAVEAQRGRVAEIRAAAGGGKEPPPGDAAPPELRPGDEIEMRDNPGTRGLVLDDPAQDHVVVGFGSMRMRVPVAEVRLIPRPKDAPRPALHVPEEAPRHEVDLRGMYGDEAVQELDAFLTRAWSAGLKRVDVIHGKGTGALRKRVHDFLRDLSFVDHFALGEWNEGGSGMTKVFFRD